MRAAAIVVAATLLWALAPASARGQAPEASGAESSTEGEVQFLGTFLGQWAATDGDERKYREDYDTLESGGGFQATVSRKSDEGDYFEFTGSILSHAHGGDIDGAELHLRTGRWGTYSVSADFSRTQSFYDDSREASLSAFPFTNALGQDLDTARTTARVAGELLLRPQGRLSLVYRHRETDGDRSLLKGSVVEAISPVSFRFPAFEDVDVRSDAVDVEAAFPAGPLNARLSAGYTAERNRTTTNEINFGATSFRDRARFRDDVSLRLVRAGVSVETPPESPVLARAGYRFFYADGDADARQTDGETGTDLVRTADGISVIERNHSGHVGLALSPLPHLVVRAAYTVLGQNRDGGGTEFRVTDAASLDGQEVRSETTKDLLRHRPRVEITYGGLPRTLLRASYRFERVDRDLQLHMLGGSGDGVVALDRMQDTDEDKNVHRALLEARVRVHTRLLVSGGYRVRREDIDESVAVLVNEVTLGDRERARDTVFARARLRPYRRTTLEVRGEYQREDFDRNDVQGLSKSSSDAEIVSAHAVSAVTPRLVVSGLFSFANRDYDVGTPRRDLGLFRAIEFRGRSTTGSVAASYSLGERTTLRGQYNIVDAGGSLDNLNHRLFLNAAYTPADRLRLGLGYAYLDFDEGLYDGDDFTTHAGWATASVSF